jgi:excisionase family DNA binding protein
MSKAKQPLLLTVREVSKLLRIHRPKVYDLLRAGTIEGFKLGSDWRIKRESVEKLVGPIPENFFGDKGGDKAHADGAPDAPEPFKMRAV